MTRKKSIIFVSFFTKFIYFIMLFPSNVWDLRGGVIRIGGGVSLSFKQSLTCFVFYEVV